MRHLASCLLLLFVIVDFAFLSEAAKFLFTGLNGVSKIPPLLSTMVASKAECAMICVQLYGCQSFSFRPGALGCQLFSRMTVDLQSSSQDVIFSGIWPSCPAGKGYVSVPGTSKCVLASNVSMNWQQAANTCAADGSQLLIIDNADVMQKLQTFLPVGYYHVGFNDLVTEDQHLWMDNTSVIRSLFYATEPSDYVDPSFVEDCGMVGIGPPKPGLHDLSCASVRKFICSLTAEV